MRSTASTVILLFPDSMNRFLIRVRDRVFGGLVGLEGGGGGEGREEGRGIFDKVNKTTTLVFML